MKKCIWFAVWLCLCAASVSGCGAAGVPEDVRVPTVAVDGRGQVSAWLVEEFSEDYYSLSELAGMAMAEAEAFNSSEKGGGRAAVTVEKVRLLTDDAQRIVVCYQFDNWKSYSGFYSGFNGESLFYGTLKEAAREGYSTNVVLRGVADGSLIAGDGLRRAWDRTVIITDVKANIYCPGKVTHVSGGAVVNGDGSIDTSGAEGMVYILMK